jgi:hypothetical protein
VAAALKSCYELVSDKLEGRAGDPEGFYGPADCARISLLLMFY